MPKRKKSLIKSRLKSRFNLKMLLISFVAASLLVGGYFYSIMEKPEINLIIGTKGEYINPRTTPTVTPKPTPKPNCSPTVRTISFSNNCSADSYRNISYTCGTKTKTYTQGGPTSCKPVSLWFTYAQDHCYALCPTPIPLPLPSPSPTPTPPPGTCVSTRHSIGYYDTPDTCNYTGAKYATYSCLDGYSGFIGDKVTCKSFAEFEGLADSRCQSPHPCKTPTPTSYPVITPTPTPTPTPNQGIPLPAPSN